MTTTVLAFIPSPAQGVWHLGPLPIRAYALCIITGIIAALIIGDRRWVDRGGEPGVIYDIALWAVPFGLLGGRLYHVMTDWRTYFAEGGAGFMGALRVWDGGLGIWGAVALGAVGAWIGCRRRGIPLPAFGDAVAPGVVLAQAIGRLGNYFNQELYGRRTDVPWGLEIFERRDASGALDTLNGVSTGQLVAVVHPTFLYELIWNLLVFVFLLWADRRFRLGHGRLFALYVAAYCVGRFGVELMRDDFATHIAGIRVNTFTSAFVFIGAVVYMMVATRGREDPESLGAWRNEDLEDESGFDEVGKELIEIAGTSGLVAAAKTAGAEDDVDEDPVDEDGLDDDESADAAGVTDGADDTGDGDIADEADATETESDETEVLDIADDAESGEAEAESDDAEGEVAPDSEAEVDEPDPADDADAASDEDGSDEAADEDSSNGAGESENDEPESDEPEEPVAEVLDTDADTEAEDAAAATEDAATEDAAAETEDEVAESETEAEPGAEQPSETTETSEPAPSSPTLPAWEPMAPRRKWWQRG